MRNYKILILLIATLFLTACAAPNQYNYNESSAPKTMDNFSQADIINRMTDLKNGLKPNVKPTGKKAEETPVPAQDQQMTNQKQLENLSAIYSSAVIKTNFGDMTVKFYASESPITVNNFLNLAKAGFYNGTRFHRVIKDFMIQGGDPLSKDKKNIASWGTGGPGYQFQDEFNGHKLVKGSLAMANSGINTNGSQFFIVTASSTPWLDNKHTNFGYVEKGIETVEKIEKLGVDANDHPLEDAMVNSIELVK